MGFLGWSFEGDYQGSQPKLFVKLGTEMNEAEGWGCLGPERSQTLIVLANYVDTRGIVYPGNKEIARKLRISENAAQQRISDLLNFRYVFDARGKMQEDPVNGRPLVVYCDEEGNPMPTRQRDEKGHWKKRYLRILAPIRFGTEASDSTPDSTSSGAVDNSSLEKTKAQLSSTLRLRKVGSSRENNAKAQLSSTLRVATVAAAPVEQEPIKEKPYPKTRQNETQESRPVQSIVDKHKGRSDKTYKDLEETPDNDMLESTTRIFRLYVGREPLPAEVRFVSDLVLAHGLDAVEKAFFEYHAQRDLRPIQSPVRYVRGVLEHWEKEGVRRTDVFEHLKRLAVARGKT